MYQSLYRKWRPQTFADVMGQEHVADTLRKQAASGRLSHAYIFTGTRGTGKTTCARLLVKAANCLDLRDGDPCNECDACLAINREEAVDFVEIDAASNNGVDNVRDIKEQALYTPVYLKKRAYIIDEVHMLSGGAFNALLKILEEPPEHVLFILATTEAQKVPATILSRCQRFDFRRIPEEDIIATLERVAAAEGADAAPGCLGVVASLADGALRNALTSLELIIAHAGGRRVDAELIDQALGLSGSRYLFKLYSRCVEGDVNGALEAFEQAFDAGADLSALADEMYTMTRDLLMARFQGKNAHLKGHGYGHDTQAIAGLAVSAGASRLVFYARALEQMINKAALKGLRKAEFEMLIIQLALPEAADGNEALLARVETLETELMMIKARAAAPDARKRKTQGIGHVENAEIKEVAPATEEEIPTASVDEVPPVSIQTATEQTEEEINKKNEAVETADLSVDKLRSALEAKVPRSVKPFLFSVDIEQNKTEILFKCADEICISLLDSEDFLTMAAREAEALCGGHFTARCVLERPAETDDRLAELEEF